MAGDQTPRASSWPRPAYPRRDRRRFGALSLVAIGGINAILPEIHRIVVDVEDWMTSADFADLFALGQLAPGPNALVVALVGWKVQASRARSLRRSPPAARRRLRATSRGIGSTGCSARRRGVVQRALAPLAIGLIMASGYTLARGADRSPGAFALTLIATAALAFTRVNPGLGAACSPRCAGVGGLA